VAFETPPNESLDELVDAEDERQGAEGAVISASVAVTQHVDSDCADDETADQVRLRREAHAETLPLVRAGNGPVAERW
jgi:hypothetical protein